MSTTKFPAPQFQLEGAISTNGVHRWGTSADAGDTYTVNTWTYGFITYDTVTFNYTFTCDRDGDGTNDVSDIDDDNDGITDVTEGFGVDPAVLTSNSVARYLDASYIHPTLGAFRDANNDGVNDLFDTDLDGKPNFLDLDSDGDGVTDAIEANAGTAPANYLNGRITGTYNSNGMAQSAQTAAGSGVSNYPMTNTDGDAVADLYDRDSDNDGIWDNLELQTTAAYKAPLGTDADGDGWDDRYDTSCSPCGTAGVAIVISNKDGADLADYRDTNSDNDASLDWIEGFDDDKNGYALNDLLARADNFAMLGGNATYYPATDANANGLPDWLDDSNSNGIPNFLDYTSTYFRDSNRNGVIDLFDIAAGQYGAISVQPKRNANNADVDFRLNTVVTSLRALTDVAVTNTVAAGPYYNNQNVTYTVSVTNNGPDAATNLVITDQFPTGLSLITANPSTGTYTSATGNWAIGTLNSGQTITLTLVGRPQTASSFTTVASVTANDGYDAITSNNSASNTITVGTSADLAVTNTVAAGTYNVGQPVTYTVTVSNNGPNSASAVQLTDLLPAGNHESISK
ncbi:MAG: DUF11 domain-containing protein [Sphingobacteriales bacterium]|nr:MAG: DUF11 domain-containing protein [Sphingobacteriales bacterium]